MPEDKTKQQILLDQLKSGNDIITLKLNDALEPVENDEDKTIELFGTISELRILYQLMTLGVGGGSGGGYSIPVTVYQEVVKFFPQVTLIFRQNHKDTPKGKSRLQSFCSYRIKIDNIDNITKSFIQSLATNIHGSFKDFSIERGPLIYQYTDQEIGLVSRGNFASDTVAQSLYRKVLFLLGGQFKYECFSQIERTYPTPKEPKKIAEKWTYQEPERGRTGTVHFAKAELHIHGMEPIALCNNKRVLV